MKYIAPDYEKVSLNVADAFASYASCTANEGGMWTYSIPCEGSEDYRYEAFTFVSMPFWNCYTTNQAPS